MEMKVTLSSIAFWWTSAITIRDEISWSPRYVFLCLCHCKFTLNLALSPRFSQMCNLYIHGNESYIDFPLLPSWQTSTAIIIRDAISWPPRYNVFCCLSHCKFTLDPAMNPRSSQMYNLYIHENESYLVTFCSITFWQTATIIISIQFDAS